MFGSERADRRACGRNIHPHLERFKARRRRGQYKKGLRVALPMRALKTYLDCLQGRFTTPSNPAEKLLFQFFVVGGMVTFMGSFNGMRHSGLDFFVTHHWVFPLIACIAFALRLLYCNKIVEYITRNYIAKHFSGFASTLVITALNIIIMAPIMTCITTAILYGFNDYWLNVADNLPISMVVSFVVNLFIVMPTVKIVYNKCITTERGARLLGCIERTAMPWMYIINS